MAIFKKDTKIIGRETVYYTNMFTGQEECVTGIVIINNETIGQLQAKVVFVITADQVLEIPDFCVAPQSQYLLKEVA